MNTVIALVLAGLLSIPGIRVNYVTITDFDNGFVEVNDAGDSYWREDSREFHVGENAIGVFEDNGTPEKEDDRFVGIFHIAEILKDA